MGYSLKSTTRDVSGQSHFFVHTVCLLPGSGVYSPGCARVARACGSQDALHRAWVAVGERLASFNGKLRDELPDREVFYTLLEVRVLTERYRPDLQPGQAAQLSGLSAAGP